MNLHNIDAKAQLMRVLKCRSQKMRFFHPILYFQLHQSKSFERSF
jgi:hypothetical protein